jgi:hypothetical protein
MNRGLWVWKLKLCLAALAAIMASAIAPQRPLHEQQAKEQPKDKGKQMQMAVDRYDAKAPAPAQTRKPAPADSHDRISAML